ncbi:MAG: hypothetical protein ACI8Q1_001275 [Parvicella sp.]|jgi:hypothetical protein
MIKIGRKDRIDLPELGLCNIEAKIDTGAYGSALHCHKIETVFRGGKDVLSFKVLAPDHTEYDGITYFFEKFSHKVVKSSSGETEHRYTIKTKLVVFDKTYNLVFSLTNREKMRYPALLGRKFLTKRFLVDVNRKDFSFKQKT